MSPSLCVSMLSEGSLWPDSAALPCDFMGQVEKPGAHSRVHRGVRGSNGIEIQEHRQPCPERGTLFGVAGWQKSFSPTTITELLLCPECPAGCWRLYTKCREGAGCTGPGVLLAGLMALVGSPPSLGLKFFGHKIWTR